MARKPSLRERARVAARGARVWATRALLVLASLAGHVWRSVVSHGTAFLGVAAATIGAGQVYGPAGWITLAVLLLADRVVDDHRADRDAREARRQGTQNGGLS